jgi:type II secretory pathway component PulC
MKDNIPPEEKLLEIIRQGNTAFSQTQIGDGKPRLSIAALKKIISSIPYKPYFPKAVISIFIFSLFLFLLTAAYGLLPFGRQIRFEQGHGIGLEFGKNFTQKVPEVEIYLQQIRKKDIFNSASSRKDAKSGVSVEGIKNIALLGIISEEPKQAIIKDKTTDVVYYLKESESTGEFKVFQVQDGKVIIEYRGERFEMQL